MQTSQNVLLHHLQSPPRNSLIMSNASDICVCVYALRRKRMLDTRVKGK